MKLKSKISYLAMIGIVLIPLKVKAQMYCVGDGCSSIPLQSSDLNNIFYALQSNYLNEVLKDMSTANAMALLNSIPTGMVNLEEFTIGANISTAQTKLRKIDVMVPNYGTIEDVPSSGVSLIPSAFIGSNIGYLFSDTPRLSKLPWYSPYRFDIFISYLNSGIDNEKAGNKKKNEEWNVLSKSTGFELRYHLAEGDKEISYLFGFNGVSLGVGYHNTIQKLTYKKLDSKISMNAAYNTDLTWKADNILDYKSKMDVYLVDIRTGIQLLYLFRFSIGAGHSWLKGSTNLKFNRYGPVAIYSDILTILGYQTPTSYLGLNLESSGGSPYKNITFLTFGFELNIPVFKIFLDIKGNSEIYSVNLGVRISL
ncbi:MAG: Lsa36 family surface (lipo)protein [Leptonema sp. (in: bacteria)]